jgi:beta-glucanase (GH16 family)
LGLGQVEIEMNMGNALGTLCVSAIFIGSLSLAGQTNHDESKPLPGILLPASDPSNKGNWTPDASMSDEFNGTELDVRRWKSSIEGWPGRPPALFVDHNVTVAGGALHITMRKEVVDKQYANHGYHDYTTGAVQSSKSMLYGYFEVRARAMNSAGSSGFWLLGKDQKNWNEIDVAEMGGRPPAYPRQVFMSVHVFQKDDVKVKQNVTAATMLDADVAEGFHVYGLDWSASSVDIYIDGRLRRHLPNTSWHTPATLILDAETQADWWGMPLDDDLPSVFAIDYVRAWTTTAQTTMPASAVPVALLGLSER